MEAAERGQQQKCEKWREGEGGVVLTAKLKREMGRGGGRGGAIRGPGAVTGLRERAGKRDRRSCGSVTFLERMRKVRGWRSWQARELEEKPCSLRALQPPPLYPSRLLHACLSLSETPGATPNFLQPQSPGSAAAAGYLGLERRRARIKGSGERV